MLPWAYTPLETFRTLFLVIGWPILVLSSIFLIATGLKIYKKLEKVVYGKLILATIFGWVGTSLALGVVSTMYVFDDVEAIFAVWEVLLFWIFLIFVITWVVQKWDMEAIELNKLQKNLEVLVIERTAQLESLNARLVDMDDRIKIQNQDLRQSNNLALAQEKQIEAIINSIGDGVFVVDAKGKINLFNPMAEKITGFSSEEVIGKSYEKILSFIMNKKGKRETDPFIQRALKTGKPTKMDATTIFIHKDGKEVAVADSASPLLSKKGKTVGCVVVFRDETERRRADQMKTEFVSLVSHQLKTPLTAIRWGIESLEQSSGANFTEKQSIYLNDTKESTTRLIQLVNELLSVSRMETGRLKISVEEEHIEKLIKTVVSDLAPVAKAKKVKVVFKKPKKKFPKIKLDASLFYQVMQNLISNAIRYTEVGGKVEIEINEKRGKGYVISIQDNGIGIPDSVKASIFKKFFRAKNAIKEVTNGNGLGLYLVKMIMDLSGGSVQYESVEGVGTTFYVTIPKKGMKESKRGTK